MQQELERWEIGEKFWSINLNKRDRFGDLGMEWRIILKLILNSCLWGFEFDLSGLGSGSIVERCERWNEPSNYIQKRNLFFNRTTGRRYSDSLRAVRYGVRTLLETRSFIFSLPFPIGPGAGSAFSTMSTVYRGVAFITHPYLAPRLRMSGAIPLLPFYASYGVLWSYQLSEC
jgi:hypothetical protein